MVGKRTTGQREKDLLKTARLWAEGGTLAEIGAALTADKNYTLSETTISKDVKEIKRRYSEQNARTMESRILGELIKLGAIERAAWRGWKESKGEPRFLETLLKVRARTAALLGLDAPKRAQVEVTETDDADFSARFSQALRPLIQTLKKYPDALRAIQQETAPHLIGRNGGNGANRFNETGSDMPFELDS